VDLLGSNILGEGSLGPMLGFRNKRMRFQNWMPGIEERPMNKKTPSNTGRGINFRSSRNNRDKPTSACAMRP